ncbi:CGNR zinc finger domain-containing protein [Nonomuraea sp. NPDC049625]|uniref:CGNR zinc finger domain-containing protein n=1 Tax=Nonomuraea sp. NPDC049625 TaxID=3155775 RepID=UPI00343B99CE
MNPRTSEAEPLPAFVFVGGRPCLDLVDTLGKRGTLDIERLPTPERLGRWLREVGLANKPPLVSEDELDQARKLREAIYRLVRCVLDGTRPDRHALAVINRMAAVADLAPRLEVATASGTSPLTARWPTPTPVGAALSTLARDGIDLLSGPLAARVKECESPDCTLVFLDDSQARRRRWCSMDRCGNLAKIAKYRSRGRDATSSDGAADR